MKQVKIKTRKEIQRGEKGYVFIGSTGVARRDELPKEYLEGNPMFHLYGDNGQSIYIQNTYILREGEFYMEEVFNKRLSSLKDGGNRLHQIMERIREDEKIWNGEETFVI